MFTGIVEEVGQVKLATGGQLQVAAKKVTEDMALGASICVSGVCLTVTSVFKSSFSVDVVPETIRRSNLGDLKIDDFVNLERPLPANGRFGGHIVQGHVDGTGTVESIEPDGDASMVRITVTDDLMRYIVPKGFITVDGVSLTVVNCDSMGLTFTLVPHTHKNTVFQTRKPNDRVNLEIDILSKYVERLHKPIDTAR